MASFLSLWVRPLSLCLSPPPSLASLPANKSRGECRQLEEMDVGQHRRLCTKQTLSNVI